MQQSVQRGGVRCRGGVDEAVGLLARVRTQVVEFVPSVLVVEDELYVVLGDD